MYSMSWKPHRFASWFPTLISCYPQPTSGYVNTETILHFFNINRLGRTGLLDSVYIHQKPRQNFSPPNFKFVNRERTEKLSITGQGYTN